MSYYKENRNAILEYQKCYNIINHDTIKQYQKEYYQKNKEHLVKKQEKYREKARREMVRNEKVKDRKPLALYKIDALERMLRKKLRDYYDTLDQEEEAIDIVDNNYIKPFTGFTMRDNKFVLNFD